MQHAQIKQAKECKFHCSFFYWSQTFLH